MVNCKGTDVGRKRGGRKGGARDMDLSPFGRALPTDDKLSYLLAKVSCSSRRG
jgi:hypothetical protein